MDKDKHASDPLYKAIWDKLSEKFQPSHLEVITEKPGHWKVIVVSEYFKGLGLLDRHRSVQDCLKTEMESDIHALTIVSKTAEEWAKMNQK